MKKQISIFILVFLMMFNSLSLNSNAVTNDQPIKVMVDGEQLIFDVPPVVHNNRTLVPVRAIFEALGATVDWDSETNSVIATKGIISITLPIGETTAYVNEEKLELDVPSKVVNNRTMVPIRFISESLECEVEWVGETRTVVITTVKDPAKNIYIQAISNLKKADNFKYEDKINYRLTNLNDKNFSLSLNVSQTTSVNSIHKSIRSIIDVSSTINEYDSKGSIELFIDPYVVIQNIKDNGTDADNIMKSLSTNELFNKSYSELIIEAVNLNYTLDEISDPNYYVLEANASNDFELEDLVNKSVLELPDIQLDNFKYVMYIGKNTYLPYKVILSFNSTSGEDVEELYLEAMYTYDEPEVEVSSALAYEIVYYSLLSKNVDLGIEHKKAGNYEEAVELFELILSKNHDDYQGLMNIIETLYEWKGYTEEVQSYIDILEKNYPTDSDALILIGNIKSDVEGYEKGIEYFNKVLEKDPNNALAFNYIGVNLYYLERYDEALEYFNTAIANDKELQIAYSNKAELLYSLSENDQLIQFVDESMDEVNKDLQYDLLHYKYSIYSNEYNFENMLEVLKTMLTYHKEDEDVLEGILYALNHLQKHEEMPEYITQSKEINSDNEVIKYFENKLEYSKKPLNVRIYDFVKENYLYFDDIEDFEKKSEKFLSLETVTPTDIKNYLVTIVDEEDYFTALISDEGYDKEVFHETNKSVGYKQLEKGVEYVKINSFNLQTYTEFRQIMNKIDDKKNKKLVIDLRDNFGGNSVAATRILDYLLDDCVSSTIFYRDGSNYNNYSDEYYQPFKEIDIYVNRYSASSSELLILGLKTYLDNVTVIGERTFGKGVGQNVFNDKENKVMIYLTSFYWNVKQNNIHYIGITPDIQVEKDEDSYYFDQLDHN